MNDIFDLRRLWLLIRGDLIVDLRPLSTTAAALTGVMLLASMYTVAKFGSTDAYYVVWYAGLALVWAPIVASVSFRELHDKTKNEAYLMLPASALEKVAARLVRTTIGAFAFILVLLSLASALIEGMNALVLGQSNALFNPFAQWIWTSVGHVLVGVSVYFAGAAWFRKNHFVKTALALTVIPMALIIFASIVARLVFSDIAVQSIDWSEPQRSLYNIYVTHEWLFRALLLVCKTLYFAGIPALCWYLAWLRVKEAEASHGI